MKKLKHYHYIILLLICVIILVSIVALTMGSDAALSTLLTGSGGIIGLTIGIIIRQKTEIGKEIDAFSTIARRQLIAFLITGAVLTIVAIALIYKYL